jgi:hypothetical protein
MTKADENLEPKTAEALIEEFQQALWYHQAEHSLDQSSDKKRPHQYTIKRQVRIAAFLLAAHNLYHLSARGVVTFYVPLHIPRIILAESSFNRATHLNRECERRVPSLPPNFELLRGETDISPSDPMNMAAVVPG